MILRRAACAAVLLALAAASYWTLRLGWADHLARRNTVESLQAAIRALPWNAAYHARLAALDPARAEASLQRAVALNPRYARGWIELGLLAEHRGETARAERLLLEAWRVDRTFEPRWALANHYFRQGQAEGFWRWARLAAEMSYGDRVALFRLCWRFTSDAAAILDRAIPGDPAVLAAYLAFLLKDDRLAAAPAVLARLAPHLSRRHEPLLLDLCDRQIEARSWTEAVATWNALAGRKLLPYAPLDPARGASLTNGDFAFPPAGRGFDWQVPAQPVVNAFPDVYEKALRIELTGRQPESCDLLAQPLPLAPATRYRLSLTWRADPGGGFHWSVVDPQSGSGFPSQTHGGQPEADWKRHVLAFTTPPGAGGGRLALSYRRPPGAARFQGSLWLRAASLEIVR
jgi:hypothetical protein